MVIPGIVSVNRPWSKGRQTDRDIFGTTFIRDTVLNPFSLSCNYGLTFS
jgi:hypothetical protein